MHMKFSVKRKTHFRKQIKFIEHTKYYTNIGTTLYKNIDSNSKASYVNLYIHI